MRNLRSDWISLANLSLMYFHDSRSSRTPLAGVRCMYEYALRARLVPDPTSFHLYTILVCQFHGDNYLISIGRTHHLPPILLATQLRPERPWHIHEPYRVKLLRSMIASQATRRCWTPGTDTAFAAATAGSEVTIGCDVIHDATPARHVRAPCERATGSWKRFSFFSSSRS